MNSEKTRSVGYLHVVGAGRTTKAMTSICRLVVTCFCLWPLFIGARDEPDGQRVEIKCLVPAKQMADLSKRLDLGSRLSLRRVVCVYDSESLSLFEHKPTVILRSRYDSTGTDTTVKVQDGGVHLNGAQCEFDKVLGKDRTLSCSVTDTQQAQQEIKKANAGKGVTLFEVSAKVPLTDEAKTAEWIAGLVGVSTNGGDQQSETKTRIVLEHFRSAEH